MQENEIRAFIQQEVKNGNAAAVSNAVQAAPGAAKGGKTSAQADLNELLAGSEVDFIERAYHVLLHREAEEADIRIQREQLRDFGGNRIMLLGQIHRSGEGKEAGVNVPGLEKKYFVARLKFKIKSGLKVFKKKAKKLIGGSRASAARVAECEKKIEELGASDIERRSQIDWLNEDMARLRKQAAVSAVAAPQVDEISFAVANALAGSTEQVTERLQAYLPCAKAAVTGKENGEILALDLACRRGEWLNLLHAENIAAVGVDENACAVAACTAQDLNVQQADAVEYLETMSEGTFRIITAFGLVEALPADKQIRLFAAAGRALSTGGVLMLAAGPADGAGAKPLPAQLLAAIAQQTGFEKVDLQAAAGLFAAYKA